MRQRKVKNLEEKLLKFDRNLVALDEANKGNWKNEFRNENDIYLECGSGRGDFLLGYAEKNENINYIGIEGQDSVVLRALEKLQERNLKNVRFCAEFIKDLNLYFDQGELKGIYLNFSDPWPKKRHQKRRLTHRNFLLQYWKILKEDGSLEIKTDNDELFEFSLQEIMETEMFEIVEMSRDLHNSDYEARKILTEYEKKFTTAGKNINYMKVMRINLKGC